MLTWQFTSSRQSEFADVQELKRSSTRRFFLKLTSGKDAVEKKTHKEEQEYLEAYAEEHNAKAEVAVLERELVVAIKAVRIIPSTQLTAILTIADDYSKKN